MKFGGLVPQDDSEWLSTTKPSMLSRPNIIFANFAVVQFASCHQREQLHATDLLSRYASPASRENDTKVESQKKGSYDAMLQEELEKTSNSKETNTETDNVISTADTSNNVGSTSEETKTTNSAVTNDVVESQSAVNNVTVESNPVLEANSPVEGGVISESSSDAGAEVISSLAVLSVIANDLVETSNTMVEDVVSSSNSVVQPKTDEEANTKAKKDEVKPKRRGRPKIATEKATRGRVVRA